MAELFMSAICGWY